MAKKYNRIMLGRAGRFAKMCREEGYIGANFDIWKDLSDSLPDNWRQFNKQIIPLWLEKNPEKKNCCRCGLWLLVDDSQRVTGW